MPSIRFHLAFRNAQGSTLPPFDDNNYQEIKWKGQRVWPKPMFADWIDQHMPDLEDQPQRCSISDWVTQDHLGDDIIIGMILDFSDPKDAMLFKLAWQ